MSIHLGRRFRRGAWLALGVAVVLAAGTARALYIRQEIEKVPVERLVKNLQAQIQKDPKEVPPRLNLARLHAMAFALKTDTAEVIKGKPEKGPWFGYEPKPVPFKVEKTDDAGKLDAARKHLEQAITRYEEVLKLKPDHLIALLGHAWAVAQRGDKEDAIKAYRAVIEKAWAKEKAMKVAPLGWHSVTAEAANYLIPLLDAEKDKEEIAKLKERTRQLKKIPRPVTPVAVSLRDGLAARDLIDTAARVRFDLDGSALPQEWTWITKDAAWLVHDPRRTGKVTSALQLFGNVTFWCFWENGYEALAALDNDHDGLLAGKELDGLALWRDRDGDGVSDPGEVRPLAVYGITGLSCRHEKNANDPSCVAFSPDGVHFKDGKVRPTYDLVLRRR